MGGDDDFGVLMDEVIQSRESGPDTGVIHNFLLIIKGDIEINP
jgi:hypothetical protein